MNQTNFEHAGYAALMQLVIGLITGDWFAGACFGIAFFLGREHAQAQDKLGYTLKTTFQAFDVTKWSKDAQLDLLFPVVTCLVIWGFVTLLTYLL
jgi:hypothetical protein